MVAQSKPELQGFLYQGMLHERQGLPQLAYRPPKHREKTEKDEGQVVATGGDGRGDCLEAPEGEFIFKLNTPFLDSILQFYRKHD